MKDTHPAEADLDEQQLVAAVLAGDPQAEREFYDAHVDRVYRLAYRMTGDAALAEDLTQDTFLRAFDRLSGFRGQAALSTWLHSIAVSVAISALRRVKRHRQREIRMEGLRSNPGGQTTNPVDLRMRLTAAIDGLSEKLRLVFIMHDMEGYKHREIAEILRISAETSKVRLMRAHEKLREALA